MQKKTKAMNHGKHGNARKKIAESEAGESCAEQRTTDISSLRFHSVLFRDFRGSYLA